MGTNLDNGPVTPPKPGASTRIAFLSSGLHVPAGNLDAMDALCQAEAEAAGLPPSNSYLAFLGTDTADPIDRFDLAGGNWVRPDGVRLANSPADFAQNVRLAPLTNTASGTYESGRPWTGATSPTQASVGETCTSWQDTTSSVKGRTGWAEHTESQFQWVAVNCNQSERIYCLQK
jgi:hypothetical protein